jgi:hypothetical protein
MSIHDLAASHLRAGNSLRPKELNGSRAREGPAAVPEPKSPDKIEISAEAKLLAAQAEEAPEEKQEISQEAVMQIRRWIDDGFYDLPTTVEEVARRILESGDL